AGEPEAGELLMRSLDEVAIVHEPVGRLVPRLPPFRDTVWTFAAERDVRWKRVQNVEFGRLRPAHDVIDCLFGKARLSPATTASRPVGTPLPFDEGKRFWLRLEIQVGRPH